MADVSCAPNVNTGETYYNYEMHNITSFNVCATNDVLTFHVPYLSSLSPFSGTAERPRGSKKETADV